MRVHALNKKQVYYAGSLRKGLFGSPGMFAAFERRGCHNWEGPALCFLWGKERKSSVIKDLQRQQILSKMSKDGVQNYRTENNPRWTMKDDAINNNKNINVKRQIEGKLKPEAMEPNIKVPVFLCSSTAFSPGMGSPKQNILTKQ